MRRAYFPGGTPFMRKIPVSFTIAEFTIALSADRINPAVANGTGLPVVSVTRPDTCPKAPDAITRYNTQMMNGFMDCVFTQKNRSYSLQKKQIDEHRYPLDEMHNWKEFR